MSKRLEARLRRLEKLRPEQLDGFRMWVKGSGEPKPETKPGDTLIIFELDDS